MARQKAGEKKAAAADFESMLQKNRERSRAQTLAQKLLGKESRRKSTGATEPRGSLSSRAGIKKRASMSTFASQPKDLASRIAAPGTRKAMKIAAALERVQAATQQQAPAGAPKGPRGHNKQQQNGSSSAFPTPPAVGGMSIRGLAGPFIVAAENFANGTTAADIESAVAPIGGIVQSCRIVQMRPIVKAEITFESREGAERVIQYFDGKMADSRVLRFYAKVGGNDTATAPPGSYPQAQPRQAASQIVDGSHGFDDPMETDAAMGDKNRRYNNNSPSPVPETGSLYSDKMMPPTGPSAQRKGRGFDSWRGKGMRTRGRTNNNGAGTN